MVACFSWCQNRSYALAGAFTGTLFEYWVGDGQREYGGGQPHRHVQSHHGQLHNTFTSGYRKTQAATNFQPQNTKTPCAKAHGVFV